MFGWDVFNSFYVKGKKEDVKTFLNTVKKEKKYMDSYIKNGLNDPKTVKNKSMLKGAISKFERQKGHNGSIDFSKLSEYEKEDYTTGSREIACTGNSCEI